MQRGYVERWGLSAAYLVVRRLMRGEERRWQFYAACVSFSFLLIFPVALSSQSAWLGFEQTKALDFEIERPNSSGFGSTLWTGFLSGRVPLGEAGIGLVEIPVQDVLGEAGGPRIGNPYIGMRMPTSDPRVFWEFGIRLPLGSDRAVGSFLANPIDRRWAFGAEVVSISGSYHNFHVHESGVLTRIRVGAQATTSAQSGSGSGGELLLKYAGQVGFRGLNFLGILGVSGGGIINSGGGGFAERTIHQFGVQAGYSFGRFRPGVQIRVPLDDVGQSLDFVVGFNIAIDFDQPTPSN